MSLFLNKKRESILEVPVVKRLEARGYLKHSDTTGVDKDEVIAILEQFESEHV